MMKKVIFVIIVLLTFCVVEMSYAAIVSYDFTGHISAVNDPSNVMSGAISVDDPFIVRLTYDTSIPDNDPDPDIFDTTFYPGASSPHEFFLDINGYTTDKDGYFSNPYFRYILMNNNYGTNGDSFYVTHTPLFSLTSDYLALNLNFVDSTGIVFSDDSLPESIDLAAFDTVTFFGGYEGTMLFAGEIDSVVPIPSAIWLLSSALIGLLGFRKKFKKS